MYVFTFYREISLVERKNSIHHMNGISDTQYLNKIPIMGDETHVGNQLMIINNRK